MMKAMGLHSYSSRSLAENSKNHTFQSRISAVDSSQVQPVAKAHLSLGALLIGGVHEDAPVGDGAVNI